MTEARSFQNFPRASAPTEPERGQDDFPFDLSAAPRQKNEVFRVELGQVGAGPFAD